jgi:hypothetical protein
VLQGLPDPGDRLRRRVGCIRSLCLEETRHRLDRLLIAEIRGHDVLDQTALVKLLALRQRPLGSGDRVELKVEALNPPLKACHRMRKR